jgi:hypothetical protein
MIFLILNEREQKCLFKLLLGPVNVMRVLILQFIAYWKWLLGVRIIWIPQYGFMMYFYARIFSTDYFNQAFSLTRQFISDFTELAQNMKSLVSMLKHCAL